eukprot:TRINITY_DN4099_c0_g1_i1.p1 TRINITY_DN4099_c0_g1~~TRINITY_DN4099_c0_g1_i1.p1  ORF type:complete len:103 (-),score=28.25 TRINITY_DN4099_c0_g1_i1:231-539(-)
MIFSLISDIIIFCTLIANAGAILNFSFGRKKKTASEVEAQPTEWATPNIPNPGNTTTAPTVGGTDERAPSERFLELLASLRFLRTVIAFWNFLVVFLMIVFF